MFFYYDLIKGMVLVYDTICYRFQLQVMFYVCMSVYGHARRRFLV